jgi:hypothetical protein
MGGINSVLGNQRPDLAESMTKANSVDFNFNAQQYLMTRPPEYWVYLYSVSEAEFEVYRPPILKKLRIKGREAGKQYIRCARFPQPLLIPHGNVDSMEVNLITMDARRFAMDIINPDNLGFDQDTVIANPTNIGNDLGKKGVFWSINEVPTEQELKGAVRRMEAYYNSLLEKARTVETSDPKALTEMLTPEHHTAADYFGVETSWHSKRSRPMDCPNCGDRVKANVAFHRTEEGGLCIIDWKRAVAAGVRTKAQAMEAGAPGFEAPVASAPAPKVVPQIPTEDTV